MRSRDPRIQSPPLGKFVSADNGFVHSTVYLLPNDEEENDRLDIYHHLMGLANDGRLHRAPLNHPQRILDLGTGTGIWAMQMGKNLLSATRRVYRL